MPDAAQTGLLAVLENLTAPWRMAFGSVQYLIFLPIAVAVYFLLPKTAVRRVWLLLASYYFYFFAAPKYLIILLGGTLASWLGGLWCAAAGSQRAKRGRMLCAVGLLVLGLCFFKYNGFFAGFLSPFFENLGIHYQRDYFVAAGALGISFYTFTAIGYLIDVSRGDVPAEKNLLNYALFIGFFPTVTMGPIARANSLLPQLKDTSRRFEPAAAPAALVRMATGFFKKLAVADTLSVFTDEIYGNLAGYAGGTLFVAAVAFALQLYFDFSGYSDIVIGSAQLLGIKLPENFQNPYFATNFSGFWARWHISLSGWLQDYIFTPLVWSRWTEKLPFVGKRMKSPPVLTSLVAVFLISGVWHGDTLCFLVWGGLQAAFRIGEEVLHRTLGKPRKRPPLWQRIGKTAVVLLLWVESLVFFRVGMPGIHGQNTPGTVADAFATLARQFSFTTPATLGQDITTAIANGFVNKGFLVALFIAFCLFCLVLALWADWAQCFKLKGRPLYEGFARLKPLPRYIIYYLLVLCCFAGFILQSGGFGGASFLYGGF